MRVPSGVTALERAYQDREPTLLLIRASEFFNPLREDPRFIDLTRRLRLPE